MAAAAAGDEEQLQQQRRELCKMMLDSEVSDYAIIRRLEENPVLGRAVGEVSPLHAAVVGWWGKFNDEDNEDNCKRSCLRLRVLDEVLQLADKDDVLRRGKTPGRMLNPKYSDEVDSMFPDGMTPCEIVVYGLRDEQIHCFGFEYEVVMTMLLNANSEVARREVDIGDGRRMLPLHAMMMYGGCVGALFNLYRTAYPDAIFTRTADGRNLLTCCTWRLNSEDWVPKVLDLYPGAAAECDNDRWTPLHWMMAYSEHGWGVSAVKCLLDAAPQAAFTARRWWLFSSNPARERYVRVEGRPGCSRKVVALQQQCPRCGDRLAFSVALDCCGCYAASESVVRGGYSKWFLFCLNPPHIHVLFGDAAPGLLPNPSACCFLSLGKGFCPRRLSRLSSHALFCFWFAMIKLKPTNSKG